MKKGEENITVNNRKDEGVLDEVNAIELLRVMWNHLERKIRCTFSVCIVACFFTCILLCYDYNCFAIDGKLLAVNSISIFTTLLAISIATVAILFGVDSGTRDELAEKTSGQSIVDVFGSTIILFMLITVVIITTALLFKLFGWIWCLGILQCFIIYSVYLFVYLIFSLLAMFSYFYKGFLLKKDEESKGWKLL